MNNFYDLSHLGKIIKKIRNLYGYSIDELAEISQLSKSTIIRIESGNYNTRIDTIDLLSTSLNIDITKFCFKKSMNSQYPIDDLILRIDSDLHNRDYSNLENYIEECNKLFLTKDDSIHNSEYRTQLSKMILWIESLDLLVYKSNATDAYNLLLPLSTIIFSQIKSSKSMFASSHIDLLIFNTFLTTKIQLKDFYNLDQYYDFLINAIAIETFTIYSIYHFSFVIKISYNYCAVLLKKGNYSKIINFCEKIINNLNSIKATNELAQFHYLKSIAEYKLSDTANTRKIEFSLYMFTLENKGYLIPLLLTTLEKDGISINLDWYN